MDACIHLWTFIDTCARRVSDMSDLDKLSPLMNLLEFTLQNNPVARKQLYRATAIMKLPSLRCVLLFCMSQVTLL